MPTIETSWTQLSGRLAARVLRRTAARRPFACMAAEHTALVASLPPTWNERSYLTRYPDVAREVLSGTVASGYAHWLQRGYGEGRVLHVPDVPVGAAQPPREVIGPMWDEAGYLGANPHVEVLLALGVFDDGLAHYWAVRSYQTPRLVPPAAWNEAGYLWTHADVADAVDTGALADGYTHWLRYGAQEGRLALPPGMQPPPRVPARVAPPTHDSGNALPAHAARTFSSLAAALRERRRGAGHGQDDDA